MSRDLPAGLDAAIDRPVVRPFMALHIATPDPVYAWTGQGTLIFDDADGDPQEWIGAGGIGTIDEVGEGSDGSATGVRATLLQVPSEFREDIAQQATRGVAFEIYVGALNETMQQVEAAHLIWKGRLDEYRIIDAGSTISVQVTGESRAIDQKRPAIKRFTDEYQQRQHPGDKFFEYVPQMSEIPIIWNKAEPKGSLLVGGGVPAGRGGLFSLFDRA